MECTNCGRPMDPNSYEWCDGNCQPRHTPEKNDWAVEGLNHVEFVPALVLPAKASTEAGTDAGTETTSIYQGLRGVALMEEYERRNSYTRKAIRALLCFVGVTFLGLLALAILAY